MRFNEEKKKSIIVYLLEKIDDLSLNKNAEIVKKEN